MLALTLGDYQPEQRQIVIRRAKGDEPVSYRSATIGQTPWTPTCG
jgi:hypothetical protein